MPPDIFSYIKTEEAAFTQEIQLGDNWWWNLRYHVQIIFHLVNGIFFTGENKWLRAFKNIMEPIIALSAWTEDIEVKDIVFYADSKNGRVLSFLIKKYYQEKYVKEHDIDALLDEITESDLTYGGVLNQKGVERPETLALNSIAFCDQTDMMGGPVGFKLYFSPTKLRQMSKYGWGSEKNGATMTLDELCTLATSLKDVDGTENKNKNKVPGKTIEVYIVRGDLPEDYLKDDGDPEYQCNQVQIVAFYHNDEGEREGVILYRKKDDGSLKFFTSKKVHGRALGRGVGEALLHPQIWTNFFTIHKTALLEAASKVPLYTDDAAYANRNKIQEMENLEITVIEDGKQIRQVPTAAPANIQLIQGDINDWFSHAQFSGQAYDPILGKEAVSGTTFRGQERSVAQGKGAHDKRRGQRAKYVEELHRDWIIPDMTKEMFSGTEFLAELSSEEMRWVMTELSENHATQVHNEMVLNGVFPELGTWEQDREALKQKFIAEFVKMGNRRKLKILEGEFRDVAITIGISVSNKQKNLADLSDKLLSIFQFVFADPQKFQLAMQIPALAESFENILEFSGMSIANFNTLLNAPAMQPQTTPAPQPTAAPLAIK